MSYVIADTSGILVLIDAGSADHAAAMTAIDGATLVMSPLVLTEVDYLITKRRGDGGATALAFAAQVRDGAYTLATWGADDHAMSVDVATAYADMVIGLADASNVVLAHRFRTVRIVTIDQHFRAIKPLSGAGAFTLLPSDN